MQIPADAWKPGTGQDGTIEEDKHVAEITHLMSRAGKPLAIVLRPGNAGSNTAADHAEATRLALAQLPRHLRNRVLIRTGSAGGTRDFLTWLTRPGRRLHYSAGFTITPEIQDAILKVPATHGPPLMTATARYATARGSRRSPACWTCRPGRRGCGSSSAGNAPTQARSCGSPTSSGTASPPWPPIPRAGSFRTWNCGTGGGQNLLDGDGLVPVLALDYPEQVKRQPLYGGA
jgi:hypothetical protein